MPNIIDSLFLELGIDTSKFSKDQQKAIGKIQQFESQAKRSAGKAADSIKTVGAAFRDLSKDTSVGASAAHLDTFAKKLKALGQAAQVSGGAGTPFGLMAEGLGMLLSPAALGVAAIGLLGKGMWDLNKNMSAANATMDRQAQLSGMNADNLWAWGEAAKVVGANPGDITGGISSVQTAIAGMMIGAGNATPQLTALSRLGLGWNADSGLNDAQVTQMFTRVHQLAASKGFKNLGGLRALTGPIMNDAMFALATSPNFTPASMQGQIKAMEPANLGTILQKSLQSQEVLGKLGIREDILKEVAFGGEQGLMAASVDLLTRILGGITAIADIIAHPGQAWDATIDAVSRWFDSPSKGESAAMKMLTGNGFNQDAASAIVGNLMQESSMSPFARNAGHVGLGQWDSSRQAAFAKQFGYTMGSSGVPGDKQFDDQMLFLTQELRGKYRPAAGKMAATTLAGKVAAFMHGYEVVNDSSFGKRLMYAMQLSQVGGVLATAAARHATTITNETHIGEISVHTPSTDPAAHADAVRKGIATHPLVSPAAQGTVALGTRGMTG